MQWEEGQEGVEEVGCRKVRSKEGPMYDGASEGVRGKGRTEIGRWCDQSMYAHMESYAR